MTAIELARTCAAYGQTEDARRAYTLSLQEAGDPAEELEAAAYIFDSGGDYRVAYTHFQSLYNRGLFQEELLDLMTRAFYLPNLKPRQTCYRRNCKLLSKYPYLFRKDFLPFDRLPIQFFPFDDKGFTPYDTRTGRFGDYVDFNRPVVGRNFFRDLEKPILAADVYSQYELEYLNDTVRRSDWVGRENHIYLHYTDWAAFCAHLQCLDLRTILREEKVVFLIGGEVEQYPIDFKARFGIDYSQYTVKPLGVREIKRLIWHTQLSSHNGGDFFNEIFFGHPNLLANVSLMLDNVTQAVQDAKKQILRMAAHPERELTPCEGFDRRALDQLRRLKNLTDKDVFVAIFLSNLSTNGGLDQGARIAPAVFFQPHFHNLNYQIARDKRGWAVLHSDQYQAIQASPIFRGFRYIKTFTPMRRPTTSYAASVKFMYEAALADENHENVVGNVISDRLLNRSFMIDREDRLYKDSVLVRFEDGKLNPRATFTALAAFLDLPYTESMTYCSGPDGLNPESLPGNARGFDPAPVYRTYDEYANDAERYFLEYFLRDAYAYYGYGFQYYDGKPVDKERARALIAGFTTLDGYIRTALRNFLDHGGLEKSDAGKGLLPKGARFTEESVDAACDQFVRNFVEARQGLAEILLDGLYFVNRNDQPLHMMPLLKLDPALLENPLYH